MSTRHLEIEAQAAAWLARQDADTLPPEAQQEFEAWLAADLAHRVAWLRLRQGWQRADGMEALRGAAAGRPRAWRERLRRWGWALQDLAAPRPAWGLAGGAAALALVAIVGVQQWRAQQAPSARPTSYVAELGSRQMVALEDGTRLTLNTRSKVRVAVTRSERRVWVDQGEVFFDVAKDPEHPFVVIAGDKRITVLGTKFSVYRKGEQTQVTVLEGRVRVESPEGPPDASAVMLHGQVAVADKDSMLVVQRSDREVENRLAWRSGRLVFERQSLAEIAAEFNRYNRRQLVVQGEAARLELGGSFDPNNLQGFIELLSTGFGIKASYENEQIVLRN
ncbi:FecR domain-containing protein [Pelomonas sp. KK5]|uniref:FecR family protein n=1 Tax=Pelomonas sp. KK5 TaxID=1855730 RepID=UPI00097C779A|nr:FecR domain-containing protein [Pelomonas sp. KK5]